jgi:hypothetical protein
MAVKALPTAVSSAEENAEPDEGLLYMELMVPESVAALAASTAD